MTTKAFGRDRRLLITNGDAGAIDASRAAIATATVSAHPAASTALAVMPTGRRATSSGSSPTTWSDLAVDMIKAVLVQAGRARGVTAMGTALTMANSKLPMNTATSTMPGSAQSSTARKARAAASITAAPATTLRSLPQRSVRVIDNADAASSRAPRPNVAAARTASPTPNSSCSHGPNVTNRRLARGHQGEHTDDGQPPVETDAPAVPASPSRVSPACDSGCGSAGWRRRSTTAIATARGEGGDGVGPSATTTAP